MSYSQCRKPSTFNFQPLQSNHFLSFYSEAFRDQWLVGIEFKHPHIASWSWSNIRSMGKTGATEAFNGSKIILCKRNVEGQIYAAHGFRDMVHFTVGSQGKTVLCKFLKEKEIKYYELRGFKSDMPSPSWFNVSSIPHNSVDTPSEFLCSMQTKMKQLGKAFIPHLMKVCITIPIMYLLVFNWHL